MINKKECVTMKVDKVKLKAIMKRLDDIKDETLEAIELDKDTEMNTDSDIYGQIQNVIGNIEMLLE